MGVIASQITSLTIVYSTVIQAEIKENIKALHHWPLWGQFTDEFPAQMASNAENVSIWWRHHGWSAGQHDNLSFSDDKRWHPFPVCPTGVLYQPITWNRRDLHGSFSCLIGKTDGTDGTMTDCFPHNNDQAFNIAIFASEVIRQSTQFMGLTWGPPGSCRPQMGPIVAPWTLLSGHITTFFFQYSSGSRYANQSFSW